jgi:hypothetical protein
MNCYRCNTFFYVGVDPNEIDQVNEVRARSAGGVPGRRHNLMIFLNQDIIYGLFFYSSYAYFHMHIFRNNCQSHEYQSNSYFIKNHIILRFRIEHCLISHK